MIGITENRLKHILSVARKCYEISKEMGYDETFCRKMFTIGFLHDIGYEFSEKQEEHPDKSAELLNLLFSEKENIEENTSYSAIKNHGRYTEYKTEEWKILNMADMQVDSKGNYVSVSDRLEDIKERYGELSDKYLTACDICYQVGLTAVNLASNKHA